MNISSTDPSLSAEPSVSLVFLDGYHQEDPLFLQQLGRALSGLERGPCVLLHGGGERVARLLEAQGVFPEPGGGYDATDPDVARQAERAVLEANQQLVSLLTEAGVPAVGLPGTRRRLLRRTLEGIVTAPAFPWAAGLAHQGTVPVVAALVPAAAAGAEASGVEVPLASALLAAAEALQATPPTLVFFGRTSHPGLFAEGALIPVLTLADPRAQTAARAAEAMHHAVAAGHRVLVTNPLGLAAPGGPEGTLIQRASP